MDISTVMGEPLWERKGPIKGDGPCLPFHQANSVRFSLFRFFLLLASPSLLLAPLCLRSVPQLQFYRVYQLLGESGTYYGVRFGKNIPWVREFPFGFIKDPQYVGSIMSLVACLSWVPFQYILLWSLGYLFMIHIESTEDVTTRAKPLS
ncbi:phosphatidyl-N-methylethanolamine N-methyltransferase isoform X2 [Gossypium hirsutum]|uniref:phosphatidyl-N-methylethanolamine N-methyltransferase n=1 Tax=Gossypium hirsutum TaxID=3635 RepID=A0ABM3A8Q6_GOSHI|nr:phosphatidyl-N-methylethanolamine N-methyltransferase isoform X2 [Gossypium hirsutum]